MKDSLKARVEQARRDALMNYCLSKLGGRTDVNGARGATPSPEELYRRLLIDPLQAGNVVSGRIPEAIASLQQYLGRVARGDEPFIRMTPDELAQWRQSDSRYAIWAGARNIQAHPDEFLDPALRSNRTAAFRALENALNQARLDADAVRGAVQQYLCELEVLTNLDIVSAYVTEMIPLRGTMYFVARTKTQPYSYFWRQLELGVTLGRDLPLSCLDW